VPAAEVDEELSFLSPFYTLLLMIPENFFTGGFRNKTTLTRLILAQETSMHAELYCIGAGLRQMVKYWEELDEYLGRLITQDFLRAEEYMKALFDDNNFTRSRKYFWAIGCLTEFIASISDNIKQWDLYYEGRVQPILERKDLEAQLDAASITQPPPLEGSTKAQSTLHYTLNRLLKQARDSRNSLEELKSRFESKIENVKALRDGVNLTLFAFQT
jgi:hypothetical protein